MKRRELLKNAALSLATIVSGAYAWAHKPEKEKVAHGGTRAGSAGRNYVAGSLPTYRQWTSPCGRIMCSGYGADAGINTLYVHFWEEQAVLSFNLPRPLIWDRCSFMYSRFGEALQVMQWDDSLHVVAGYTIPLGGGFYD